MRASVKVIGGIAIVLGSFVGTTLLLDHFYPNQNYVRAEQIKTVKAALESYRAERGRYPYFQSNPLTDLASDLSKFIPAIPQDPVFGVNGTQQYYYVSDGQQRYAILVSLSNRDGDSTKACLTGINFAGTGWWQGAPPCPF